MNPVYFKLNILWKQENYHIDYSISQSWNAFTYEYI